MCMYVCMQTKNMYGHMYTRIIDSTHKIVHVCKNIMEKNRGGHMYTRPLMESNTQHHITLQCTPTIQGENFKNCISTSEQNTNMCTCTKKVYANQSLVCLRFITIFTSSILLLVLIFLKYIYIYII